MNARRFQSDSYSINALLRCILLAVLLAVPVSAVGGGDLSAGSDLILTLEKERAYPGESVPVTIILTIQGSTVRNIRFPEFASSQLEVSEIRQLDQQDAEQSEGMIRYRFGGRLKPVRPGRFMIGPATLSCEVMENAKGSSAFFGGLESRLVQLVSAPATLEVLPLPANGKPDMFSGAVGIFTLSVKSVPAEVNVGDPVTVTTTIHGNGKLASAMCPNLINTELQSFPVKVMQSAAQLTCEQVVIPNRAIQFPPIIWSYFDPDVKEYRVLRENVGSLVMDKLHAAAPQHALAANPMVKVPNSRKPVTLFSLVLSVMAAFVVILGGIALVMRKRNKLDQDKMGAEDHADFSKLLLVAEDALVKADVEIFYTSLFRVLQHVVGSASGRDPFSVNDISSSLLPIKIPDVAPELETLFERCNRVRYGMADVHHATMTADFARLCLIIKKLHSS